MDDSKIRRGLDPRRNVRSLQTQQDITIPAGTIIRSVPGATKDGIEHYEADVAFGQDDPVMQIRVALVPGGINSLAFFRPVVAS